MAIAQTTNHIGPDLGPLITSRGRSKFERVMLAFVLGVVTLAMAAGFIGSLVAIAGPRWKPALLGIVVFVAALYVCVRGLRIVFQVVYFHQFGAVERYFNKQRLFRFNDIDSVAYTQAREYVQGVCGGTLISMCLQMLDGRRLNLETHYKDRAKGLALNGLEKELEFDAEMDVIRDVIAAHVASRLWQELESAGSLDWNRVATLTLEGVIPHSGPCKAGLIAWSKISWVHSSDGCLHFVQKEQESSILAIHCGAPNFWAYLQVIETAARLDAERQ